MPPRIVNQDRVQPFPTEAAFEEWLAAHHASDKEVWIRIYKKGSGVPTITPVQAIDVALCWGWTDGVRKDLDETSFLQRYTPRQTKSVWSQINRDSVARLTAAGRMKPPGQRQVDRAKADGRLNTADPPMRNATATSTPADQRVAMGAAPLALESPESLGRPKVSELASRTNGTKTAAGRAKKNAGLVALPAPGGAIVPERGMPVRTLPKRPARANAKPAKKKPAAPKRPAPTKAKPAKRKPEAPKRTAAAKAKPAKRKQGASKRPASAKAKPAKRKPGAPRRPPQPQQRGAAKRAAVSKRPLKAKAKKSKGR